jgi:hypothetical protein
MPEINRPHTHKLKNSEPHLKEKTTTQVSLPYLTCRTSTHPKTKTERKQNPTRKKNSFTKLLQKQINTQNKKLGEEQKEKIYQQRKFSF